MIPTKTVDINIRKSLKSFFIDEVIAGTPNISLNQKQTNCLLVLDDRTAGILDKFVSIIDLIEAGVVGIERLNISRKRFESLHVIYFIEPTEENINLVKNDFRDPHKITNEKGEEISIASPLYDFTHFVFISPIKSTVLANLISNNSLVQSMLSIRQINMDIMTIDENLFSLNFQNEDLLLKKQLGKEDEEILEELASKAMSIFTLIKKVENVQLIFEKTGVSEKFAEKFRPMIQEMVDGVNNLKVIKDVSPPVFFLIANRGSDLLSPLISDISLSSLHYNLHEKTENTIEFEVQSDDAETMKTITSYLNDTDPIWTDFKYKHISQAKKEIQKSFEDFSARMFPSSKKGDEGEEMNADQLAEDLRNLPQLEEAAQIYQTHLSNIRKLEGIMEEIRFDQIFELEQMIATKKKRDGNFFDFNNDFNKSAIITKEAAIRIALLLFLGHNKSIPECLSILPDEDSKSEFKILATTFDKARTSDTSKLLTDETIDASEIQYYHTNIRELMHQLLKNKIFNSNLAAKFSKVDIYPAQSSLRPFERNCFRLTTGPKILEKFPIVVVFFIGGISYNEVAELSNMTESKEYGSFKLILGGTNIYSNYSFVQKYLKIEEERVKQKNKEQEKIEAEKRKEAVKEQPSNRTNNPEVEKEKSEVHDIKRSLLNDD